MVLAVNKWDAADKEARARMKAELAWKLGFLGFAETHFISAKEGKGLGPLMRSVDAAHGAAMARLSTPKLTRALIAAVERQAPPKTGLVRPKLRYAHQGGVNPPRIIIHGNALDRVPDTYKRYLENHFQKCLQAERHADADRVPHRPQPLRRQAQDLIVIVVAIVIAVVPMMAMGVGRRA